MEKRQKRWRESGDDEKEGARPRRRRRVGDGAFGVHVQERHDGVEEGMSRLESGTEVKEKGGRGTFRRWPQFRETVTSAGPCVIIASSLLRHAMADWSCGVML
jgi:hypothetical protein